LRPWNLNNNANRVIAVSSKAVVSDF